MSSFGVQTASQSAGYLFIRNPFTSVVRGHDRKYTDNYCSRPIPTVYEDLPLIAGERKILIFHGTNN